MIIEEKRNILSTITKLRSVLRENNISCHGLNNSGVVIAFAKLKFNEVLDPNIKKIDAYSWVGNKMINNNFNYPEFKKSKKEILAEKMKENIKASKELQKKYDECYGNKKQKNTETIESILLKAKDLLIYEYVDYDVFLYTPYWRTLRKAVLLRDNNKCCHCGGTYKLMVHHLTYIHHYKEHEHLEDLITVCELCHGKIHKDDKNKVKEEWQKPTFKAPLPWRTDSIDQLQKLLEYRLLTPEFRQIVSVLSDEELMCAIYDFAETKYSEGYEQGVIKERMEEIDN